MGQLKFEKKFSEKLDQRELKPKASSWEELSTRLNSEEKSKNPVFWWIGIAATLLGGILIVSGLFNEPISKTPGIVETSSEVILEEAIEIQHIFSEKIVSKEVVQPGKASVEPVENSISEKISGNKSKFASIVNQGNIQNVPKKKEDVIQQDSELIAETQISKKPEDVIEEVFLTESQTGEVGMAEVDALLAGAAAQISSNRNGGTVSENNLNANALLWDVEMELEQSFREKVFDVLKEGYLKAKTAVANRNY